MDQNNSKTQLNYFGFLCTEEEKEEMENFLALLRNIPDDHSRKVRFLQAVKAMGASFGRRKEMKNSSAPGNSVPQSPSRDERPAPIPPQKENLTSDQKKAYEILCGEGNVLLTGGAGTGKTFLLQKFIADHQDVTLVTAPSGIAAKKAGGITLHRAFRIPIRLLTEDDFSPAKWLKTEDHAKASKNEALLNLQTAQILIIDEISMVRSDVFSWVMKVLKTLARGGKDGKYTVPPHKIRVILCGDFYQLSPVIDRKNKETWQEFYPDNPKGWCFHTKEWKDMNFTVCELKETVRQKNPEFVEALNRIREGDAGGLLYMNSHRAKTFQDGPSICPTNMLAGEKNEEKYNLIQAQEHTFTCRTEGEVDENELVCEKVLHLKVGTRVLFLVNDQGRESDGKLRNAYQNGSYGEILAIHEPDEKTMKNG